MKMEKTERIEKIERLTTLIPKLTDGQLFWTDKIIEIFSHKYKPEFK